MKIDKRLSFRSVHHLVCQNSIKFNLSDIFKHFPQKLTYCPLFEFKHFPLLANCCLLFDFLLYLRN